MIRRIPRAEVAGRAVPLEELARKANATPTLATQCVGSRERAALARALTLLLSEELRLEPAHIARVLERELLRVRRAEITIVRVHPDDLALLKAADHYVAALALEGSLELAPDDTLSRGGCVLTSNLGEVDAQIETRLELALTLLRSGALT